MAENQVKAAPLNDDIAERRRGAILAAAESLLAVHGYDALRLRDVAARAQVSIGMIQHYFVTRDELLRETVRAASEHRVETWAERRGPGTPATQQLTALLDGALGDLHRCTVWVETCAAATRHPELREDVRTTQAAWRAALSEVVSLGIESGEFTPQNSADDVVTILVSLIDGLMLETAAEGAEEKGTARRRKLLREFGHRLLGISE